VKSAVTADHQAGTSRQPIAPECSTAVTSVADGTKASPSHAPPGTVPAELAAVPQWVAWQWEERDGKPTKPPLNPHGGQRASTTDPATWGPSGMLSASAGGIRGRLAWWW
jgi:hypothetical protein